jgi:hypothetical protein
MKITSFRIPVFLLALFLTACTGSTQVIPTATYTPATEATVTHVTGDTPIPFPTNVRIEDETEYRIPSMMGFDAIAPIYEPTFASAYEAPMEDTELIMGVVIDGQAKAYPVNVLRFREMVNDEIAGWPILVTW